MMRLPEFEFLSPDSVEEACETLDRRSPEGRILAGGTDLLVAAKLGNVRPTCLISLRGIESLGGIVYGEDGLRIGAMTTLHRIREDPLVKQHYSALAQAAAAAGSPQIQRMGTLGGNLCLNTRCYFYNQSSSWRRHRPACFKMGGEVCHVVPRGNRCYAVFSADTPPALIALDGKAKLMSRHGARWVAIRDLYTGDGREPLGLREGEILTEVRLPPITRRVSTYLKYRIRKSIDFPLAAVAACVEVDERGEARGSVKIVLNAVGSAPVEIVSAETSAAPTFRNPVASREIAEKAIRESHPVANAGSTPAFRRKMVGILVHKALRELTQRIASPGENEGGRIE